MNRPSLDAIFMAVAATFAQRATCPRASVGAVIGRDGYIIATGYNGAPRRLAHCTQVGCRLVDDNCARSVHAEMNAVAQAARLGHSIADATLYCTHLPCLVCARLLIAAGVIAVRYSTFHGTGERAPLVLALFEAAGITCRAMGPGQ